jgi:2-haloacid dehalogenase
VTTVVAVSNADLAELAGLSRHGGLAWHAVVSGEQVRAFKPDPAVYQLALRLLDAQPSTVLMVAAHPWDLRAAAEHGMATAYVPRPGADGPQSEDEFDLQVPDLVELATLLRN